RRGPGVQRRPGTGPGRRRGRRWLVGRRRLPAGPVRPAVVGRPAGARGAELAMTSQMTLQPVEFDVCGPLPTGVTLLAAGDAATARGRLAQAIAGFDAATIATTHGFCQEVLGSLGIAGDLE